MARSAAFNIATILTAGVILPLILADLSTSDINQVYSLENPYISFPAAEATTKMRSYWPFRPLDKSAAFFGFLSNGDKFKNSNELLGALGGTNRG